MQRRIFLGSVDFFWLWWFVSLSIGLGVLYKRPTRGIAISLIGIYLGLAVSRRIVEAHDGRIGFDSLEKGTRFWFDLPLGAA